MSIRRRCLLFRIILKSVLLVTGPNLNNLSDSRHLTRPAFLFSLFLSIFFSPRSLTSPVSVIRNTENGNIRICMDAAKSRVNQSSLAKLTSARSALDAAKNNGRCMSGPA